MAVDAHHLLLSPPQLLFSNRESMMNTTIEPARGGYCNTNQTGYGVVSPFADNTTPPLLPTMYNIPTTADYYADGANVACDFSSLPTRKRSRDSSRSNHYHHLLLQNHFLGQDIDISSHINQQQHEVDRFVSLHMERVRFEIEQKRKRQARMIMEAIEHELVKRLRVKEEERERLGKVNHALEERVKSLAIENQFWRNLAQTNEATANHLRTNLEHVLAQANKDPCNVPGAGLDNVNETEDDAQSWCGSSSGGEDTVRRTVAMEAHEKKGRMCRNCGEEESCVLLLPCRHLCLCGVCGSSMHTCPICKSPKNASVHVNMSS